MEFSVRSGRADKQRGACVVVAVFKSRKFSASADALNRASRGAIATVVRRGDMSGDVGRTLLLHDVEGISADRVLLVGFGKQNKVGETHFRRAVAAAALKLREIAVTNAALFVCDVEVQGRDLAWKAKHAVESIEEALYRFDQLKSKKKDKTGLRQLRLFVPESDQLASAQTGARQGEAVAEGVYFARDLGNLPGNVCTPTYLAVQAKKLQRTHKIKTTVLDEVKMKALGMQALLCVARGSREPPRLIVMEYRGARSDASPVVLVGKGLTFDAGGISLKPAAKMDEMKFDMCGAASVFGTMKAAATLRLPLNLIGIVPSSENLPDGAANKPGDVVTSMSGQTIEILNTDAEGRLILCDALTYAARYKPSVVIDIATLTGACVVALGAHPSGLFSNDDALAENLLEAGETCRDRAWRLPLWEDYQEQLDSNFADVANVGGRDAGAITAACFLARFTEKFRWAHLDIAGTAWKGGKDKGATGRPVPLLTQFLIDRCANA